MSRTILVIPCYNEAERFSAPQFSRFLEKTDWVEFVFVDDGSVDNTSAVLHRVVRSFPERARVLRLPENRGKAEAVRRGVLDALEGEADQIGYWDADLATPLETATIFRQILKDNPDLECVIGSRVRLLGRSIDRQAHRHYVGRIFATAASLFLRLPVYDTQCGAKLFRATEALEDVFRAPFVTNWIFDVEVLARMARAKTRDGKILSSAIYEYPLDQWADIPGSKVRLTHVGQVGLDFMKLIRAY